ncbi:MAG: DUF1992 domain-containing protein [Alphaproteobacteria bacterium]|nr:DUF1992 domain-containing protein [Alphaproteobacteria bacterium]
MSHPLDTIIESAIREAQARGEFDNLAGAGKPLEDVTNPADAVIDRLMKESKAVPPAVLLQRDIAACKDRLNRQGSEAARQRELKTLSDLQTRLAIELEAANKYR